MLICPFISNLLIGEPFRAGNSTCNWHQFFEIWNTENNTEAQICVINQNLQPDGNDFALDDFLFYELEETLYDTTMVIIEALIAAKKRRYYFPNAFSPNFDGRNDYFQPYFGKGVSQLLEFKIFNRWGSVLYAVENCEPNETDCRWDGQFNGKSMQAVIYLYAIKIKFADKSVK